MMSVLAPKPPKGQQRASELNAFIREAIRRGQLKPGQRLGTAKQLAKYWQVSYSSVRQSLETLAASGVVQRRKRAGTFVSSDPQSEPLQTARRHIIGLLVPDIRMPDHSLVARHVQDAGREAHFEVLVSNTDNQHERFDQSILYQLKAGVDGLVLIAPQDARLSLQTLLELEKSGIPIVNYARGVGGGAWPTVATDIFRSTYLPIQHLCQLGRKKIALLSYSCSGDRKNLMLYGVYRAIADAGLNASNLVELLLPETLYLNGLASRQSLGEFLGQWLDENPGLDAICCTHDHIAAALLSILPQRGVRVPEDVALTGLGNMGEFFGLSPGDLTTVNTRIDKAAAEMVRLLQSARGSIAHDQPAVTAIEPELIVGRSTLGDAARAQVKDLNSSRDNQAAEVPG